MLTLASRKNWRWTSASCVPSSNTVCNEAGIIREYSCLLQMDSFSSTFSSTFLCHEAKKKQSKPLNEFEETKVGKLAPKFFTIKSGSEELCCLVVLIWQDSYLHMLCVCLLGGGGERCCRTEPELTMISADASGMKLKLGCSKCAGNLQNRSISLL